jgi:hypothetical protein
MSRVAAFEDATVLYRAPELEGLLVERSAVRVSADRSDHGQRATTNDGSSPRARSMPWRRLRSGSLGDADPDRNAGEKQPT